MKTTSDAESGRRVLFILAAASLVALDLAWQWWLVAAAPYPARYDYDEGVYAATAAAAADGNPLYTSAFLSQPPLLIGVLAHTFTTFGRSLASARGTVVAFSSLWLAGLAAIAVRTGGFRAAVWAVAIAASAPAFVVASHTVQMEGPAEVFAALSVALGFAAGLRTRHDAGSMRAALWASAGVAAGLAVMTKLTALTCFAPLIVVLVWRNPETPARRRTAFAALLAGGAALAAVAALVCTRSLSMEMWRQTVTFHTAVARLNPPDLSRTGALLAAFAAANWFSVALGLAGLASVLPRWRYRDFDLRAAEPGGVAAAVSRRAVAVWLAVDVAALLVWRPLWPHHFAILVTPLAVLAALTAEIIWRRAGLTGPRGSMRQGWWASPLVPVALTAVWLFPLTATIAAAVPEGSATLQAAVAQTGLAVPPAAEVVTDDPLVAFLANRSILPTLCDTSEMRMRAGWLTVTALRAALRDPRVRGIVLWRGTFRRMAPEFVNDAMNRFPRRWTAAPGRLILAR
ncbi:MAG TPA: glycosyltransferase family 39 protein [bacterium]|nr:glycosyltransferase family 39 protein [bacterium]